MVAIGPLTTLRQQSIIQPLSRTTVWAMGSLQLLSCGSNAKGQLANGTQDDTSKFSPCLFQQTGTQPSTTLPPETQDVIKIVTGANHTVLLLNKAANAREPLSTYEVYGCGDGSRGQLGPLPTAQSQNPIIAFQRISFGRQVEGYDPINIAACWETTFVVFRPRRLVGPGDVTSDLLVSMGANDFGDLGVDSARANSQPTNGKKKQRTPSTQPIIHTVSLDHLLPKGFTPYRVAALASGTHHVIAIVENAAADQQVVVGWGQCRHGQLGPNAVIPQMSSKSSKSSKQPSFTSIPVLVHLTQIPRFLKSVKSVSAGHRHSAFLFADGTAAALGSNQKRQISGVESLQNILEIGCTWNGTYALTSIGGGDCVSLWAAGSGEKGQLGRGNEESFKPGQVILPQHRLIRLACGSEHVLSILQTSPNTYDRNNPVSEIPEILHTEDRSNIYAQVWGWGWNEHGNLGNGSQDDATMPTRVWHVATISQSARDLTPEANLFSTEAASVQVTGIFGEKTRKHWVPKDIWAGCGTSWILVEELVSNVLHDYREL